MTTLSKDLEAWLLDKKHSKKHKGNGGGELQVETRLAQH